MVEDDVRPDWARLDPTLYLVTDGALCAPRSVPDVVAAAVAGGVSAVQVRAKGAGDRDLLALVRAVQAVLAERRDVAVVVDDAVDVAMAAGADGVHVGQGDLPAAQARSLMGPRAHVGLSVGSAAELDAALALPVGTVDLLGIGPVWPTATKGVGAGSARGRGRWGVRGLSGVRRPRPGRGRAGAAAVSAPVALSVAGVDPSGGAGVAADLKTFAALGVYGTVVVSALTAQSTRGVAGVHPVPAAFVTDQLATLLGDVTVHATKIGMLPDAFVVEAVAAVLEGYDVGPVVCDPVMVSTSGDALADDEAVRAIRGRLLPLADLITPNAPEAAALLGVDVATDADGLAEQARALLDLGPRAVLVKGGHLGGAESVDVLATRTGTTLSRRARVGTTSTHGTGCTLSSALAALLARRALMVGTSRSARGRVDHDLDAALPAVVEVARDYLQEAIVAGTSLGVGSGHGPVHHAVRWW